MQMWLGKESDQNSVDEIKAPLKSKKTHNDD